MPVLINFKICDNAQECNGIAACKAGALSWDSKKKTIVIDNSKCISCGVCAPTCMVDAIKVAKTDAEYKKFKKEIDEDPRRREDLLVDRYGAQPMHKAFLTRQKGFDREILTYHDLAVAEFFKPESIICLYCSIPIKELFKGIDMRFRKVELCDGSLMEKYSVKKLPALLFFKQGKLLGKVEGAFGPEKKEDLMKEIKQILKK